MIGNSVLLFGDVNVDVADVKMIGGLLSESKVPYHQPSFNLTVGEIDMRKWVLMFALCVAASGANAGFTCQQIGQLTVCDSNGPSGPSVTCQQIGQLTVCD
jgi:hypothetical protein